MQWFKMHSVYSCCHTMRKLTLDIHMQLRNVRLFCCCCLFVCFVVMVTYYDRYNTEVLLDIINEVHSCQRNFELNLLVAGRIFFRRHPSATVK